MVVTMYITIMNKNLLNVIELNNGIHNFLQHITNYRYQNQSNCRGLLSAAPGMSEEQQASVAATAVVAASLVRSGTGCRGLVLGFSWNQDLRFGSCGMYAILMGCRWSEGIFTNTNRENHGMLMRFPITWFVVWNIFHFSIYWE